MKLLRALNRDAKNWWVNSNLRKAGNHKAARLREREAIKNRIQDLRLAKQVGAYITLTNYYPGIKYAEYRTGPHSTQTRSISGMDRDLLKVIAESCNIPVINLVDAPSQCYNELMNINPDLSNLPDIIEKIEALKNNSK